MTSLSRRGARFTLISFVLAVGSTVVAVAQSDSHAGSRVQASVESPLLDDHRTKEAPQKARDLLQTIRERRGEAPPGYVGGRTFHNRERRLPKGRYREYDVNPKLPGRPRDGERIVIEQGTGKAYYTADHYRTFIPIE